MAQILVRAGNGQIACLAPDHHVWGSRERWPSFVVLVVPDDVADVLVASIDPEARNYVDLEVLSDEELALLSVEDRIAVETVAISSTPVTPKRLELATGPERENERSLFQAFVTAENDRAHAQVMPDNLRKAGRHKQALALEAASVEALAILRSEERRALRALDQESARVKAGASTIVANLRDQVRAVRAARG